MKTLLIILITFGSLSTMAAKHGNVIQVSRKLRMSYREPNPPKEYYVDLGTRDGLKVGDVIEVYRMVPVVNSMSGGAWHLMRVSLGELRLTVVGESTAIGRSYNDREPQALPSLEYQAFMIGDEVEFKTELPNPEKSP